MLYIIVRSIYNKDGEIEEEWFLEKRKDVIGWTTDLNYCASKFSFYNAIKNLELVRQNYGYDMYDKFTKSEFNIEPYIKE